MNQDQRLRRHIAIQMWGLTVLSIAWLAFVGSKLVDAFASCQ